MYNLRNNCRSFFWKYAEDERLFANEISLNLKYDKVPSKNVVKNPKLGEEVDE
ncbi:MAG: hypothetical protein ACYST2_05890 [Planctomycetota bacterium]|jgi:hypothetical protein